MPTRKTGPDSSATKTLLLDFEKAEVHWAPNAQYPLNLKDYGRSTEAEVVRDINNSEHYLIVTGFTSLSYIISFFGNKANYDRLQGVRIILGWTPDDRVSKFLTTKLPATKELKERWLKRGYSILENAGAIIALINLVDQEIIRFKISGRIHLHAKIYVGDTHALLGSPNFSKNGLNDQMEASVRVEKNSLHEFERNLYRDFSLLANNFYLQGHDFKDGILKLLERLLKVTSWQEALARAIHELLEPTWYNESVELREKIFYAGLWPIQKAVIGEALSILQEQGCVLIATPTGSGKTKLICILQLILHHWLIDIGRQHKAFSHTICPPLIIENWHREKRNLFLDHNMPISMGILSFKDLEGHKSAKQDIQHANILVVDEAHNFLHAGSQRSQTIAGHKADMLILSTATPINKKSKDLLRIIELLGVDNLDAAQLSVYRDLVRRNYLTADGFRMLKGFISRFIVRQTKHEINKSISLNPEGYVSRDGEQYRFPRKEYKVYPTGEDAADKKIAREIVKLAERLTGVIYLVKVLPPDYEMDYPEEAYVNNRIESASRLARYSVSATLRSSKVALVEHVEGTAAAEDYFGFRTSKNASGNILSKIEKLLYRNRLPEKGFPDSLFPDWLNDLVRYREVCEAEITLYRQISVLAKKISDRREQAKAAKIHELFRTAPLVLAFDNTVITLDYLYQIMKQQYPVIETHVATGKTNRTPILKKFARNSKEKNVLALCSDTLSEGVNLQGAPVLLFLDIPSVLRKVEQRIGRIDRLDSRHASVEVYFPDDSAEFALRTDIRLLKTMIESDYLIGNNFDLPPEMMSRYEEEIIKARKLISLLKASEKEDAREDRHWKDFHDAYKPVRELYEGSLASPPLIRQADLNAMKGLEADIKVKLSIGYSRKGWLFLALKGTRTSPPKWFFISPDNTISTDLGDICNKLRSHLGETDNWSEKWVADADIHLKKYLKLLQQNERMSLPPKRKNALQTAEIILHKMKKNRQASLEERRLLNEVLDLFKPNLAPDAESINYYLFAQQWLDVFNEELLKRRIARGKKKTVISLLDFAKDSRPIIEKLTLAKLEEIKAHAVFTEKSWNNVASCILAIPA